MDLELAGLLEATKLRLSVCHPLHLDLLRSYGALSNIAMIKGDSALSLETCDRICAFYRQLYHAFHPLIGLQLYTKGDLHSEAAAACRRDGGGSGDQLWHEQAALRAWRQAHAILSVSHGVDHSLVRDLATCIGELRT